MEQTKKVQIRGGFSDRTQTQVLNTTIQLKHLDQRTKNKLLSNAIWASSSEGAQKFFRKLFKQ